MPDRMDIQDTGPRPRLWNYEKYTEIHLEDDSIMLEHPKPFGQFIMNMLKSGPVVLFLGDKHETKS